MFGIVEGLMTAPHSEFMSHPPTTFVLGSARLDFWKQNLSATFANRVAR